MSFIPDMPDSCKILNSVILPSGSFLQSSVSESGVVLPPRGTSGNV